MTEPADVHKHECGVVGGEGFVGEEPPLVEPPWSEVLDDDIALCRKSANHIASASVAQIEGDGALVARDRWPPQAVAVDRHAPRPHRIAIVRILDLDDLGAIVAEQLPRERPRDEASEFEDADIRQRAVGDGHVCHACILVGRISSDLSAPDSIEHMTFCQIVVMPIPSRAIPMA